MFDDCFITMGYCNFFLSVLGTVCVKKQESEGRTREGRREEEKEKGRKGRKEGKENPCFTKERQQIDVEGKRDSGNHRL